VQIHQVSVDALPEQTEYQQKLLLPRAFHEDGNEADELLIVNRRVETAAILNNVEDGITQVRVLNLSDAEVLQKLPLPNNVILTVLLELSLDLRQFVLREP